MKAILDTIQFGIMSDHDILSQSVCEVSNTKLTGPNSIYDERMGVLENGKLCVTCNKNNKECIGHFGHVRLNVAIAHPLFYKSILSVLRCICYRCSHVRMSKEQFEFHGLLKYKKQTRFMKALKLLEKMDTCLLCHTLQPKYALSVTDKVISMIFKINNEIYKNVLYDYEIKKIFENMLDSEIELLGFDPKHSHPRSLILNILPVLPPVARPYIISDNMTCDDDLTIQYLEIIKANTHLVVDSSSINEMKRQRYIQSLKFRIKCLFDNSQERSKHSNGRPLKGIKKRLTGKEGQLRNNLMGKRVDKSARTVIGPDPTLKVNEIAVPYEIADTLTYPVKVTDSNITELTSLLHSHRINYVIRKGCSQRINMKYALYRQRSRLQFGDYIRKKSGEYVFIKNEKQFFLLESDDVIIRNGQIIEDFEHASTKHFTLEVGDTVERKLQDGDVLLLNRQPTLHKGSMMAFNCKLRKGKTIRTNLAITKSFNADFDGDEMNLHAPNSVETETELRLLSSVQNHIISNQSNKPNIVIVQDGLLAAYLISSYDQPIPHHQFLNILLNSGDFHLQRMDKKCQLFQQICPNLPKFSGKHLFSFLFPDDFFYSLNGVEVEQGILKCGKITKTQLGSSHQSFISIFFHMYGHHRCEQLINEVQFMGNEFLKYHGFSVGLEDCMISKHAQEQMDFSIEKHFIETKLHSENIRTPHILEMSISNILSNTRNSCMKIAKDNLSSTNHFLATVTSGSKGDYFNITQIMAMLGQQNFQGQRIQPSISRNRRTLPHFPLDEISNPLTKFQSQGFIRNSFLKGLDPTEFWFHAITGREGITDTAMKSVTWDTPIIIFDNGICKYVKIGEWIDQYLDINISSIVVDKNNGMESLSIKDVQIPTTNNIGNITWANISHVTRHDPTEKMYQIKTTSGKSVTITDSKSLIVWNHQTNEFEERLMTHVKIGDFVPITQYLPKPNNSSTSIIPMSRYISNVKTTDFFDMNYENGIFIGSFLASGTIRKNDMIQIQLNKDHVYTKTIRDVLKLYSTPQVLSNTIHTSSFDCIEGHSKIFSEFLSIFVGKSEMTKYVPNEAFTSSEEFVKGILFGYFSMVSTSKEKITISSFSYRLLEGLNMLCTRLGIVGTMSFVSLMSKDYNVYKKYTLSFNNEYSQFLNDWLNNQTTKSTFHHHNPNQCNDVLKDQIVEIRNVDFYKYPKVYDLTVPSTLNFALANGLHVRDTATSGYIQRRMVKVAEDVQVKYDNTVRNSAGSILQFRYGYNSYDPSESVIVKNKEGEMTNFFADVGSIVQQLNHHEEMSHKK